MPKRSIRILCQIDFESQTARLWDGSGPYIDADGEVWIGCGAVTGLDALEQALNGEAYTLQLGLVGVPSDRADLAWLDYQNGEVIGAQVRIMIQPCDELDQPSGDPETKFIGRIDNIRFDDTASDAGVASNVIVECSNRFVLRRMAAGSVLSDTDQRSRALRLNPLAPADRFCERVPALLDKTVVWPRWS